MAEEEAGIQERFVFGSMWNTWALHVKIGCSLVKNKQRKAEMNKRTIIFAKFLVSSSVHGILFSLANGINKEAEANKIISISCTKEYFSWRV